MTSRFWDRVSGQVTSSRLLAAPRAPASPTHLSALLPLPFLHAERRLCQLVGGRVGGGAAGTSPVTSVVLQAARVQPQGSHYNPPCRENRSLKTMIHANKSARSGSKKVPAYVAHGCLYGGGGCRSAPTRPPTHTHGRARHEITTTRLPLWTISGCLSIPRTPPLRTVNLPD